MIKTIQPYSFEAESPYQKNEFDLFSSIVRIPMIKVDSTRRLYAEIEFDKTKIKCNVDFWIRNDSIKFSDCFGLRLYKYTTPRKYQKTKFKPRFPINKNVPRREDFPFFMVGWLLEEVELELEISSN